MTATQQIVERRFAVVPYLHEADDLNGLLFFFTGLPPARWSPAYLFEELVAGQVRRRVEVLTVRNHWQQPLPEFSHS